MNSTSPHDPGAAPPTVAVVGPGRAGGSIARSLLDAGISLPVLGTRAGAPHPVAVRLGVATCSPGEALDCADVVLLAVPDDAIAGLAGHLAAHGQQAPGRPVVAHLSGALGLEPLAPLATAGFPVAAWHVLQAFPTPDGGVRPGVVHALTTDTTATEETLARLVEALQGRCLRVLEADRARYHAAAVLAANGTAAVMLAAVRQLEACGLTEPAALAALGPLVDSAREALVVSGIPDGLTGPWVRGDAGTVARHRTALGDDAATVRLYEALAGIVERARH